MASNVFGNPITDGTLKNMPKYMFNETITRIDRARVAFQMKNAENKDVNARQYAENLKRQWGSGVCTLCLFYNATGDPVTFVTSYDYYGHIGPAPYPIKIANGQWGVFLHVKTCGSITGSSAVVVYRGKNHKGFDCDWMLAWSNPYNSYYYDHKAYTEIGEGRRYDSGKYWDNIFYLIDYSSTNVSREWNGCLSYASIGVDSTPIFEAIMTLKNAEVGEVEPSICKIKTVCWDFNSDDA